MTILDDARAGMDPSVRPQDDLFGHVNGKWLAETEIPSDRSTYGAFALIAEEAEKQVRAIIARASSARPPPAIRRAQAVAARSSKARACCARAYWTAAAKLGSAAASSSRDTGQWSSRSRRGAGRCTCATRPTCNPPSMPICS